MRCEVQHGYRSYRDGKHFGRWEAGEVIEVDPDDVEWLNADSPGLLKVAAEAPADGTEVDGEVVESDTAGTGEAVNAETGEVTTPGDELPPIGDADGTDLPAPESESESESKPRARRRGK